MNTLQKTLGQLNEYNISSIFLVDLYFSYLFIHEIGKLRVMCGIPLIISLHRTHHPRNKPRRARTLWNASERCSLRATSSEWGQTVG